jgi:hypothetical protein
MWRLLQDGAAFDDQVREVVSGGSGNAGVVLWQMLPYRQADAPGAEVVRALRTILAVTNRELTVPEAQASAILGALGLAHTDARPVLTVLEIAGMLGGVWTVDAMDMARLESASAVAVAAADTAPSQVAARLYNAAVSLLDVPQPQAEMPIRSRLLLNALGLRWALLAGTDVIDALDRLEGLDCAFSFLRALRQYVDADYEQAESWTAVAEFAAMLAQLPQSLPRDRPDLIAGAARLAEAARQLRSRGGAGRRDVSTGELAAAAARAIDALRPFLARYRPFAEPAEDPLGTGPPVAAGVVSPAEWQAIADELLHDPRSIVPSLTREFPRELWLMIDQ